jgi:hypothetical protein
MEPDAIHPKIGPYSRTLDRGAIGASIDGRSREGRFLRAFEAALERHVGGSPSLTQKVQIRRASRAMLRLELLDEKMSAGTWSDHDGRVYGALNNSLRLYLRELGLKPAEAKPASLKDYVAAKTASRAAAEAV